MLAERFRVSCVARRHLRSRFVRVVRSCRRPRRIAMYKGLAVFTLTAAACGAVVTGLAGQGTSSELQLVTRSAAALGGRDRVMALKTLQIVGYGELAYFDGGGNITGDPSAPQKWQKALDYRRTIDLEHWRTRVQQRLKMDFV